MTVIKRRSLSEVCIGIIELPLACGIIALKIVGRTVKREISSSPSVTRERDANQNSGGATTVRVKITLACSECKQRNYDTMKNKKNDPDRIELNKFCKFCRKHTLHKETK